MDLKEVNSFNQARHPWEIIRSEFICNELSKLTPKRIIDIGSGDGYLGKTVAETLSVEIIFIDTNFSEEQLKIKNHYRDIVSIESRPGDVILMSDVIEHIKNANFFLNGVFEKFNQGTNVLITVPAFQFLFSDHDVFLGHFCRYNKNRLIEELRPFLNNIKTRYFFFTPLIVRCLQLLFRKGISPSAVGGWKYEKSHLLTRLAMLILRVDLKFSFMPGLSLLLTGKVK